MPILRKPRPKRLEQRERAAQQATAWKKLRARVLARCRGFCQVCWKAKAFDVHHLLMRSLGGKDEYHNLIPVCRRCHEDIHGHILKLGWTNDKNRQGSLRGERVA